MTFRRADREIFDKLPGEVEHRIHELLRIAEVCALQGVSKTWRARIREALQRQYRWDLTHARGVDPEAHVWLEQVSKAGVNIRSVHVGNFKLAAQNAIISGFAGAVALITALRPSGVADFVHAVDGRGSTLLHFAAFRGHRDVVELLVAVPNVGANTACNAGLTPLHYAVIRGRRDVVELLVAVPNIDANAVDNAGRTPLHHAAARGRCDVVEVLVAVPNVDANAACNDGLTPLHCAAIGGHRDVVELLVAVPNIDANAADNAGRTPLDAASKNGHREVVELLVTVLDIDANAAAEH